MKRCFRITNYLKTKNKTQELRFFKKVSLFNLVHIFYYLRNCQIQNENDSVYVPITLFLVSKILCLILMISKGMWQYKLNCAFLEFLMSFFCKTNILYLVNQSIKYIELQIFKNITKIRVVHSFEWNYILF